MKHILMTLLCAAGLMMVTAGPANADAVKDRMIQRKSAVDALLASGAVGEANTGYLAFVGASRDGASTLQAENADRKTVYQQIASETGTSESVVGKRRAKQIAAIAKPGTFVQDDAGSWRKK